MSTNGFLRFRAVGRRLRAHPNGFLQLDLPGARRVHLWLPKPLARRQVDAPIHDHLYGFGSDILYGWVRNMVYAPVLDPDGTLRVWRGGTSAAAREAERLIQLDGRYRVELVSDNRYGEGEHYDFPPVLFHATEADGLSATIITVAPFDRHGFSHVLCEDGLDPDGGYDRYDFDHEAGWEAMRELWELSPRLRAVDLGEWPVAAE